VLYLPTLEGHLPEDVIRAFRALLEFYYIARRDTLTENDLDMLQDAITHFHQYRKVFSPIRGTEGFHFLDNIPSYIIPTLSDSSENLLASAPQLPNLNTSVPSKSLGTNPAEINLFSKCSQ
jgi:hypothetical protein